VTVCHIHPSLIFGERLELRSLPLRDSTWVGFTLARKYWTRMEVTDSDQHFGVELTTALKKL
jgi:hypothetical protein